MIIYECEQGTEEWHASRSGTITASMFSVAREVYQKGADKGQPTEKAKNYAFRLAVERIAGRSLDDEQFETWQMRRGRDLEPEARREHEARTGLFVQECGIIKTDDEWFGASADGLIDKGGGAEYKCFTSPEKLRSIILDKDIQCIKDQVQGCLWISGRKWWHSVLYCPALKPIGKELTIINVERDENYIEEMQSDLLRFRSLVMKYEDELRA